MKKIVIVGSPGAGKSTLAQALARILDIQVFHLDRHFWYPKRKHVWQFSWKEYSRDDRKKIEQQLIQENEQWIIEGTYLSSSDSRLEAADTIIFLDMPRFLCLLQAMKRYIKYRSYVRPDIPEGCTEQLSIFYILKIFAFPHRGRNLFFEKLDGFRKRGIQLKCLEFSHNNHKMLREQISLLYIRSEETPTEKFFLHFQSNRQIDDFLWKLAFEKREDELQKKTRPPHYPDRQSGSFLHELLAKKQEARAYEAPKPIPRKTKTLAKI